MSVTLVISVLFAVVAIVHLGAGQSQTTSSKIKDAAILPPPPSQFADPVQAQYGQRPYFLYQGTECRGGKVYEIQNVQDVDQCKNACVQFDCMAMNLFQLGEFEFMCEILNSVHGYVNAQGAACYLAHSP